MSTIGVIVIVVAVLVLIAMIVAYSRKSTQKKRLARTQVRAQRDDVQHHRNRADERRAEADLAEEKAKRARAEAELNEERAVSREHELGDADSSNGDRSREVEDDPAVERR